MVWCLIKHRDNDTFTLHSFKLCLLDCKLSFLCTQINRTVSFFKFSEKLMSGKLCIISCITLKCSVLKSTNFWDVKVCSPGDVNQHFGGTCCLHLQGQSVGQARNQQEGKCFPAKCWWTSTTLYGITSQKAVLFIVTTVRTSNPTFVLHLNHWCTWYMLLLFYWLMKSANDHSICFWFCDN
jgi:hypothetical protein